MKKLIALITTLAVAATFCGAAVAYAEDSGTTDGLYYPEFVSVFDKEIDCYAVSGSTFAMAEDNGSQGSLLYIYSGGELDGYEYSGGTIESYSINFTIADLAYEDGTLYLSSSSNTYVFSESDGSTAIGDYSKYFGSNEYVYDSANGLMFMTLDGVLRVTDMDTELNKIDDGTYSMLKEADGVIYVIRNRNLCIVEGTTFNNITARELTFEYADLSQGAAITIGDTARLLQTTADSLTYVNVPAGQYVTRIDLSDLSGTYFNTAEEDGVHTYALTSSMAALVLCTSGNAAIVASRGDAYITYSENLSLIAMSASDAPFESGQLVLEAGLYSSPYISEGTKIATLAEGATVTVLDGLDSESYTMLETDFCRVSYKDGNGKTMTGYVATGFLTAYTFVTPTDDDLTEEWNDDYSESNVIVNVVLILIIVVLIIAGVVYLAYFSGASRRNKKKLNHSYDEDSDHGDYDGYGGGYDNGYGYGNNYRNNRNNYRNGGYDGNNNHGGRYDDYDE